MATSMASPTPRGGGRRNAAEVPELRGELGEESSESASPQRGRQSARSGVATPATPATSAAGKGSARPKIMGGGGGRTTPQYGASVVAEAREAEDLKQRTNAQARDKRAAAVGRQLRSELERVSQLCAECVLDKASGRLAPRAATSALGPDGCVTPGAPAAHGTSLGLSAPCSPRDSGGFGGILPGPTEILMEGDAEGPSAASSSAATPRGEGVVATSGVRVIGSAPASPAAGEDPEGGEPSVVDTLNGQQDDELRTPPRRAPVPPLWHGVDKKDVLMAWPATSPQEVAAAQASAQLPKTPPSHPSSAVTVAAWLSALVAKAPAVPAAPPTPGPPPETPRTPATPASAAQQTRRCGATPEGPVSAAVAAAPQSGNAAPTSPTQTASKSVPPRCASSLGGAAKTSPRRPKAVAARARVPSLDMGDGPRTPSNKASMKSTGGKVGSGIRREETGASVLAATAVAVGSSPVGVSGTWSPRSWDERKPMHGGGAMARAAFADWGTLGSVTASALALDESHLAAALVEARQELCAFPARIQVWPRHSSGPGACCLAVHGVHHEEVSGVALCSGQATAAGCGCPSAWLVSVSVDRAVVWRLDELWRLAEAVAASEGEALLAETGVAMLPPPEGVSLHGAGGDWWRPLGVKPGSSSTCCATLLFEPAAATLATGSGPSVAVRLLADAVPGEGGDGEEEVATLTAAVARGPQVVLFRIWPDLRVVRLADLSFSDPPRHLLLTWRKPALPKPDEEAVTSASVGSTSSVAVSGTVDFPTPPSDEAEMSAWISGDGGQLWSCDVGAGAAAASGNARLATHPLLPGIVVHCLAASATAPGRCYVGGALAIIQIIDARRPSHGGPPGAGAAGRVQVAGEEAPVVAVHSVARGNSGEALVALLADGGVFVQDLLSVAGEPVLSGSASRTLTLGAPLLPEVALVGALCGVGSGGAHIAWAGAWLDDESDGGVGLVHTAAVPLRRYIPGADEPTAKRTPQEPQPSTPSSAAPVPTVGSNSSATPGAEVASPGGAASVDVAVAAGRSASVAASPRGRRAPSVTGLKAVGNARSGGTAVTASARQSSGRGQGNKASQPPPASAKSARAAPGIAIERPTHRNSMNRRRTNGDHEDVGELSTAVKSGAMRRTSPRGGCGESVNDRRACPEGMDSLRSTDGRRGKQIRAAAANAAPQSPREREAVRTAPRSPRLRATSSQCRTSGHAATPPQHRAGGCEATPDTEDFAACELGASPVPLINGIAALAPGMALSASPVVYHCALAQPSGMSTPHQPWRQGYPITSTTSMCFVGQVPVASMTSPSIPSRAWTAASSTVEAATASTAEPGCQGWALAGPRARAVAGPPPPCSVAGLRGQATITVPGSPQGVHGPASIGMSKQPQAGTIPSGIASAPLPTCTRTTMGVAAPATCAVQRVEGPLSSPRATHRSMAQLPGAGIHVAAPSTGFSLRTVVASAPAPRKS